MRYSLSVVFCKTLGIDHCMIILELLISDFFTVSDMEIRTLGLEHFC